MNLTGVDAFDRKETSDVTLIGASTRRLLARQALPLDGTGTEVVPNWR